MCPHPTVADWLPLCYFYNNCHNRHGINNRITKEARKLRYVAQGKAAARAAAAAEGGGKFAARGKKRAAGGAGVGGGKRQKQD